MELTPKAKSVLAFSFGPGFESLIGDSVANTDWWLPVLVGDATLFDTPPPFETNE